MWCCITGRAVPDISGYHIQFIFKGSESTRSIVHRDEGSTVLVNLGNCLCENVGLHL